jgi:anti-sigma regulatory factor (Ser/Thr protein kinase)
MTPYPSPSSPPPRDGRADTVSTARGSHGAAPRDSVGPVSHANGRTPVRYPLVSQMTPLGALTSAPGAVRAHLRSTLAEWNMSAFQEVAELLASELITNAVLASTDEQGKPVYVDGQLPVVIFRLIARPGVLVLEAWDQMRNPPIMRQVDVWDESGRGLFLVHTLAARWRWKTAPDWPGKCVWAELREPSQPLAGDS